jgi:hypothetical protein
MNATPQPAESLPVQAALLAAVQGMEAAGVFRAAAPTGLADNQVVAGLAAVEVLGRLVDGLRVSYAAEVAYLCRPDLGDAGLSVRNNFTSPAAFIAAITSESVAAVRRRVKVGEQVRPGVSFLGDPLPAKFPAVAQALREGRIGVDAAGAIIRPLSEVGGFAAGEEIAAAETQLVQQASQTMGGFGFTADQIYTLAVRAQAHLDPDGAEPRYTDLEAERGMTFSKMRSGNTKLTAILTPEQAGLWKAIDNAALSPRTKPTFGTDDGATAGGTVGDTASTAGAGASRIRTGAAAPGTGGDGRGAAGRDGHGSETDGHAASGRGDAGSQAGSVGGDGVSGGGDDGATDGDLSAGLEAPDDTNVDTRTMAQRRVDLFSEIVQRSSGLPGMPSISGAAPTINIHATLEDVISGRGVGWIDGIDEPVPASIVEQLICHSSVITTLFGQHGQVLQHGKTRRLFTPAQNRALAARDGGCVWKGCNRPPSFCESHHLEEWRNEHHLPGRTDIDNAALVCKFHHRHVHHSDWKLVNLNGVPHMIPPRWVDPDQRPQRCIQQADRLRAPSPYRITTRTRPAPRFNTSA